MNLRRLPLLVPLVLLVLPPGRAHAHQHDMAASAGVSTASLALRLGFEVLVAQRRAASAKDDGTTPTKRKESLFLIAEADKFVSGEDSGHARDGGMIGLRGFFGGPSRVEPFVHLMVGLNRPARQNVTDDDDWSGAAAAGGGVDIEFHSSESTARVLPLLRLQYDRVKAWVTPDLDSYGRATFAVSFRFE